MDTDDLSNETYKAVIITAEKFSHNLTLQFGLLSYECKNDNDYLAKANKLINIWKKDVENSIDEIFFDVKKPSAARFNEVLSIIQQNIEKVLSIPVKERKFDR